MGRQARQLSSSGFYHIVFRGINHQHIFEDESDYIYFLEALQNLKVDLAFELNSYCLMSNHVHLLVREKRLGDISLIMKRLLTKYAMYFNRKYQRSGALIASRYKSVPVEVDEYFIPLQRYIHQNPVKAGLVNKLEEYPFSSYREYLFGGSLTDTGFALELTGRDEWIRLHQIETDDRFEPLGKQSIDDREIRRRIMQYTNGCEPHEIGSWEKAERDTMLRKLKEEGLSIRQIERVTGISRGVVAKKLTKKERPVRQEAHGV
ncbi:transposase [Sporomusa termitida]|uniref:Transposase IS200 like protein n=1 Tax=Sporomusa termitida TaxID=2377 RepID=A0A517DPJ6_9FIRM|nr:transposase [Sporomusa termitida]QDR79283.1 Transposase IS200 like protein [Sporomusa termitida]